MQVTVILKDFTDIFYADLAAMSAADQFAKCQRLHNDKRVSLKIGSGAFRDAVELNAMRRDNPKIVFNLEPRRGYKLGTFIFTKGTK